MHLLRTERMNKFGQSPDYLSDRKDLLREDNDAAMRSPLGNPLVVQRNEVANVISHQNTASVTRRLELRFVIDACQPQFIRRFGINAVLPERCRQSVSLAVLIQLNSYAAHSGSRLFGSPGMRGPRTHPVLLLYFGAYFFGISQSV